MDVRAGDGALALTITSPLRAEDADAPSSGHGLRGLRERVASVRGRATTSDTDGEFRLEITLPAETSAQSAGGSGQR
ncbi:hypothetical protein D3C74_358580 [compost metagenome]